MIYICIPSYNEARTVGLLLWKIRQTFLDFPREYQLLVTNDGSTDDTAEILAPYANVLPLTVITHRDRLGYAATVEELLRHAVAQTDRPRRDCAILMHADFSHPAECIPELMKRIEGGADLVIAEGSLQGEPSRMGRWVRRAAPLLLRSAVRVPGVRDVCSGFAAFRLVTLQEAFRGRTGPLLTTEGWVANAELYGRTARTARRVETCDSVERHDMRERANRWEPWATLRQVWRSRPALRRAMPRGVPSRGPAEVAG